MIRKVRDFLSFRKRKSDLSAKRDTVRMDEKRVATNEQIQDAARYVSERFSRAITRLSEK